ncbi:MAG: hypothetical protein D6805_04980 [Planctomycetota bacterium]|nr:MAG: hypothetical protein D6805_04980 [Planctomycetota bacterium]
MRIEKAKKTKIKQIFNLLASKYGHYAQPEGQSILEHLIYYILSYDSSITCAKKAFKAFVQGEEFVDWNEVRVASNRNLKEFLQEFRCQPSSGEKIKKLLSNVFEKFHKLDLEFLRQKPIEEAKKILSSLPALEKHIIPWILAITHQGNQFPIDQKTHLILARLGVIPPKTEDTELDQILQASLDKDHILPFHRSIVEHSKKTCLEQGEMKCKRCLLRKHCLYFHLTEGEHPPQQTSLEVIEQRSKSPSHSKNKIKKRKVSQK